MPVQNTRHLTTDTITEGYHEFYYISSSRPEITFQCRKNDFNII